VGATVGRLVGFLVGPRVGLAESSFRRLMFNFWFSTLKSVWLSCDTMVPGPLGCLFEKDSPVADALCRKSCLICSFSRRNSSIRLWS